MIGANAVVLEGVRVGKGAVVGAGAVVTKDVAPHTVVMGMPAKKVKDVSEVKKTRSNLSMICASSDIFEMRPLQWGFFRYLYGKGDEDGTFRKRIN